MKDIFKKIVKWWYFVRFIKATSAPKRMTYSNRFYMSRVKILIFSIEKPYVNKKWAYPGLIDLSSPTDRRLIGLVAEDLLVRFRVRPHQIARRFCWNTEFYPERNWTNSNSLADLGRRWLSMDWLALIWSCSARLPQIIKIRRIVIFFNVLI